MNHRLRMLCLTLYPGSAASPRYRVLQFLPYLEQHGISCAVASPLTAAELDRMTGPGRSMRPFWYHARETLRRVRQILQARRYDVVFVQKAVMTAYVRGLPQLLRRYARRLVYDIDDAVHLAPPHPLPAPWSLLEDRAQIFKLMARADLVLAGNPWLLNEAQRHSANATLFPTVVDTDRFVPAIETPQKFTVGWVGNASTTVCLEPAVEALQTVARDTELVLVGADPARMPLPPCRHVPWRLESEVAEIQRFGAGIMPQPDQPWMYGKCGLKALQYMACGVPCVASPVGAANDIVRHGENGLLARSTAEWLHAFEVLRDPPFRRRLAGAGRATVEARFSLLGAAPRLLQLLESVA